MEVSVLDKSKDGLTLKLLIKGTTPAFMNTLRRTMIEEVPTMAIEDVEFRKNNGILYDEMIAHRLGLIPLKTDLKGYRMLEVGQEPGKANQVIFNEQGVAVRHIIEDWDRKLCGRMERGANATYSQRLSEKFWGEVRLRFPMIDFVGATIS